MKDRERIERHKISIFDDIHMIANTYSLPVMLSWSKSFAFLLRTYPPVLVLVTENGKDGCRGQQTDRYFFFWNDHGE